MPFSLNLYHDQIAADGAAAPALAPAHRLLYVRHGSAVINGETVNADDALYCDGPLTLKSAGAWSEVWRWELASPNAAPLLQQGSGVLSRLRMSQVVTSLALAEGTRWLLRLDRILTPAGRVADRHQHPGPGIRCLLEGAFNVQQDAEVGARSAPRRALVGDRIGHGDRLVFAADGRQIPARHAVAGRVAGQSHRPLAVRTPAAAGQLETLCRSRDRALEIDRGH